MDWNSWVIWTAQGLLWAVVGLLLIWMLIRAYFAEKTENSVDEELIFEIFAQRRRDTELEQEKQKAYAKGEKY